MPILFEGKYKRARDLQKERNAQKNRNDHESEISLSDQMEKGDLAAMLIAAFVTILPVALVVLAVLALGGYFFIMR